MAVVPPPPVVSVIVESKAEDKTPPRDSATPAKFAVEVDPVKDRVLALVAEKTGYPVDMLDLDLDLEADLGVDTVKQAEVMATVREAYGIARDDKIKLRDFPTLAHVIRFVHERQSRGSGRATFAHPNCGAGGQARTEDSRAETKRRA